MRAGKDGEFEVGMPEINTVAVESQLLLVDGATAALLVASPTEERDMAVFITVNTAHPGVPQQRASQHEPASDGERVR